MNDPESVLELVQRNVEKFPDDIPAAVSATEKGIRKLPEYKTLEELFLYNYAQNLVYTARHRICTQMKRNVNHYGKPAKVGLTEEVEKVYRSIYLYFIGGTILGEIKGNDIPNLAANERAIAAGHTFHAELLEWLGDQGVVGDKRVKDVVPERKLKLNFDRIYRETTGGEKDNRKVG